MGLGVHEFLFLPTPLRACLILFINFLYLFCILTNLLFIIIDIFFVWFDFDFTVYMFEIKNFKSKSKTFFGVKIRPYDNFYFIFFNCMFYVIFRTEDLDLTVDSPLDVTATVKAIRMNPVMI